MNWLRIPLTQGKSAVVDLADFEMVSQHRWHLDRNGYAIRNDYQGIVDGKPKNKGVYMAREIMGSPKGRVVDHIDGNIYDNRRNNLQICDQALNTAKRRTGTNNTSGHRGVTWNARKSRWMVRFGYRNITHFLGYFEDINEASRAYNRKALQVLGEFAQLNTIKENNA